MESDMKSTFVDYTVVSTRGQVVLPKAIREELSLTPGTQLVVMSDGDNILMKPIKKPDISEFSALMDSAREWASNVGLKDSDIDDAIKEVRKKKSKTK